MQLWLRRRIARELGLKIKVPDRLAGSRRNVCPRLGAQGCRDHPGTQANTDNAFHGPNATGAAHSRKPLIDGSAPAR